MLALIKPELQPHRIYRVFRRGKHLFNSMSLIAVEETLQALYDRPVSLTMKSGETIDGVYYVDLEML